MAADNHKPKRIKAPFIACSLFFTLIFLIIFITCRTYHFIGPYPLEELKSLSYVSWIPLEERKGSSSDIKAGVVKYDRNKTSDGINIYASIARRTVVPTERVPAAPSGAPMAATRERFREPAADIR